MTTFEDIRARFEAQDPQALEREIRDAMEFAGAHLRPDPEWSSELRARIEEMLITCVAAAVREAEFHGPALVVGPAVRAGRERIQAAKRYGSETARAAMERAGFAPPDYELTPDDVVRLVRAECRRVLIAAGLEEAAYDIED